MEECKKLKVAMICHFSDAEVRKHLPLSKRKLYKIFRQLLRLPGKGNGYADLAPWNTGIIKSVQERSDIDLYVLSAHSGLKQRVISYESGEIHYNFIRCETANLLKYIIPNDNLWRKLNPMAFEIKRLVDDIHPDLVLLVGAENAYYSSSILTIIGYPIYVLCQNVINNPEYYVTENRNTKNLTTELKIIKNAQYMGVFSKKHYDLLRDLGYNNYIFHFNWPVTESIQFQPTPCEKKDFDFINFALQMRDDKGYHDCIKALAIVKRRYPNVKLCLVDGGTDVVRKELKHLISELDLVENVSFIPFFAERKDLFQFLQKVRFAVLPCKIDHISGTQIQSMQYGLPVVCYKTTGTPSLNKDKECVLIAEMNDVKGLAEKMLLLMDDSILAEQLRQNSFEFTQNRIRIAQQNMPRLVENFKSIIDNYKHGTPIPEEQLFEYQLI